jgi:DEAD/DEAH box helicase
LRASFRSARITKLTACRRRQRRPARLQWGRDVSIPEIGGAAPAATGAMELQWGRDVSIPEMAVSMVSFSPTVCFNGAGMFPSQKLASVSNAWTGKSWLQWGRDVSIAMWDWHRDCSSRSWWATFWTGLTSSLQHHIVNSLGWRELRALQEQAITPVLDGRHCLLLAPTAGGKTEAAVFPLLSRMLVEDWQGLSVLYVCPIRALLNNLEERLSYYAGLVGRSCGLWHGDVSQAVKSRILAEPPDILLTTPESLEALLVSSRTDNRTSSGPPRW